MIKQNENHATGEEPRNAHDLIMSHNLFYEWPFN